VTNTPKVGKVRPSAAVSMHGPGSVVDLPELSVIMLGLDYWAPNADDLVTEPRLEQFLSVDKLYAPPKPGLGKFGGIPSAVFPEYLVCPHSQCRQLRKYDQFTKVGTGPVEYRCPNNAKHANGPQVAFAARFMVACELGHIDDFPWSWWVHKGDSACPGVLELHDTGNSGTVADLLVKCSQCGAQRSMQGAFKKGAIKSCNGRRPWLGREVFDSCDKHVRTLLRGASNAYFSSMASAITIPPWSDPIHADIAPYRAVFQQAETFERFSAGVAGGFYPLGNLLERYTVKEIWAAFSTKPTAEDLRLQEWKALIQPNGHGMLQVNNEFETSPRDIPSEFTQNLAQVMAVTRLREVRALRGFTRLDAAPESGDEDVSELNVKIAKLSHTANIGWLPAVELRGEGIFLRLTEEGPNGLRSWEKRAPVVELERKYSKEWAEWRSERSLLEKPFPGMRYLLIHSISHVLIRRLALDSGYSSSAIRERLYVANGDQPMAGLLLYTASNDSDGSLGGLVDQAKPERLGEVLSAGLLEASLCAQDPLCGGRQLASSAHLNGSACHACLLIAETSCEMSNRLLDRNVLVDAIGHLGAEFFYVH
jgi:hypothetical protein